MQPLNKHSYEYFFGSAAVIFLLGVAQKTRRYLINHDSLTINIDDTYYVISNFDLFISVSSLFALIGFIYLYLYSWNANLNKTLVSIHIIFSIVSFAIYFSSWFYFEITDSNNFPVFDNQSRENILNISSLTLFVLAQIIFILNLMYSLIKKL